MIRPVNRCVSGHALARATTAWLAALLVAFAPGAAWIGADGPQTGARAATEGPLADIDPARIRDVAQAREALDAVSRARGEFGRLWREREIECHRRVLVNSCVAQVNAERRIGEQRMRKVEVVSNAVLRDAQARERSQAEAARNAHAASSAPGDESARQQLSEDRQAREDAAAQRARERDQQAPTQADRAAEGERRQRDREEAAALRQRQARERAGQDAANAAAHAAKIRDHEEQARKRAASQAERAQAAQRRRDESAPSSASPR